MALSAGERIGPYEVAGLLGAGGMGEVYRARDTKLGRNVALKVLPASLAHDAEYLARFQREAQVLAALNHPHIAAIYGVEANAIVMELVEGRTLAEMGARPLDEALGYARQIAEALEAAHERGIVHRDLKPANVKVTPDGVVKVLDFGLAKAAEAGAGSAENSPTLTVRATEAGIILGTAGYMAPEQAAGRVVDRRADIWSFGVVLYELLVGKRLFDGESVSETLAAVLKDHIDFGALPTHTPDSMRELLRRCLDRKVSTRLQWIGEARIAIDRALADQVTPVRREPKAHRWAWVLTAVLAVALVVSLLWRAPAAPGERSLMRFTEDLGRDVALVDVINGPTPRTGPNVVVSPDGSRLVYMSLGKDDRTHLWTRRLSHPKATLLEGTGNAQAPFFSPDGKWVGFFAGDKVKKVSLEGRGVQDLCTAEAPMSATWGEDGYIYASLSLSSALVRIPAAGGAPQTVTKLDAKSASAHRWAQLLPGNRAIVYAAGIGGRFDLGSIVVQRLDTGEQKVLWKNAFFPRYLPSGHLTFMRNSTVYAAAFDVDRLEAKGVPLAVLQDVKSSPGSGGAQLDISREGTVVYRASEDVPGSVLSWVDRSGKLEELPLPGGRYGSPILSPDGTRVAIRSLETDLTSIWIYDLVRKQFRRLTFDEGVATPPRWTPDGERVVYATTSGMYWIRANGAGRPARLVSDGTPMWFSPDGKLLGFMGIGNATGMTCQVVKIEGDPDQPQVSEPNPCLESGATVRAGSDLSPDGHWIAYSAAETGDQQVYIRPFPDRGGRWQVSTHGGIQPRWSADGRRLFYVTPEGRAMVAELELKGDSVTIGAPESWIKGDTGLVLGLGSTLSASRDGTRVLVPLVPNATGKPDTHVRVVLNFFDEVKRVLRTGESH